MRAFDPLLFPDLATFSPPALAPELRGDVVPSPGGGGGGSGTFGFPVPAYVEAVTEKAVRAEVGFAPQGRQLFAVFTPGLPGCAVDWYCAWNGQTLRVLAPAAMQGQGACYRTWCELVS